MALAALVPRASASGDAQGPPLPEPRGPLTAFLSHALRRSHHPLVRPPGAPAKAGLADEDLQLALYVCYELHYRSFQDVDDGWEWEPTLLAWRRELEAAFEAGLHALVAIPPQPPEDVEHALWELLRAGDGPSLSSHVEQQATLAQTRELAVHRSAYQLKEADPHTWAIPRLWGDPKAALVQIQSDEYGSGVEPAMHATLFADTMRALGLEDRYGAYLDWIPAPTLATVNLVTLFACIAGGGAPW